MKYQITIADLLELIIIHGETGLIARLKLTRPLNDCYVQLFNSATTCDETWNLRISSSSLIRMKDQ